MNINLWIFFLLYWFDSFTAYDCSSIDLESGHLSLRDLELYINVFDDEHKNSIDSSSYSGYTATIDRSNVSVSDEIDDHLSVPMPQHMSSFPTWFLIFYLAKFITDPSILIQFFNFLAVFVLMRYIQKFLGYELVLSLRNFSRFFQLERIDYTGQGEQLVTDLSRWMLVPFAWLTEILLIRYDDMKASLEYFTYIPDKKMLLILLIIQLAYIYSVQPRLIR